MTVEQGFSALNPTEMRFLLKRESEACIYRGARASGLKWKCGKFNVKVWYSETPFTRIVYLVYLVGEIRSWRNWVVHVIEVH